MHLKEINKIIKYLILSDLTFWTGWGLVTPIFAIFITEQLSGTALTVGIAVAVYWITKAILQYPFGLFLDHCKGDNDDYFFLVWGTSIASLVPLGYLFATTEWYIYILQFFLRNWNGCFNYWLESNFYKKHRQRTRGRGLEFR